MKRGSLGFALIGLATSLSACAAGIPRQPALAGSLTRPTPHKAPLKSSHQVAQRAPRHSMPSHVGLASWYAAGPHLRRTCTGEPLINGHLTAASAVLPTGTWARVALVHGERSVIVRVNDCMPHEKRIIDLSVAAAQKLGIIERGTALVRVTPVPANDNG